MQQASENRARPRTGKVLGRFAAALLLATALCRSDLAHAAPHGGSGSFHGGGGFHGSGFQPDGVRGGSHGGFAGLHNGFGHGGHWRHGWRGGGYGWRSGDGLGWAYYPYGSDYYPDYGYNSSGQPSTSQNWYYCPDPAGYYPYVTQCNTGWQTVPAS
jgi:hypothetical protein